MAAAPAPPRTVRRDSTPLPAAVPSIPAPGSPAPAPGSPAPAASARAAGENLAVILTPGLGGIIFASTAGLLTITPSPLPDRCAGGQDQRLRGQQTPAGRPGRGSLP